MDETVKRPSVGVAVLLMRHGQALLGQRKNAHGEGTWSPPGGHLEWGESFAGCARREVAEETGLEIANIRPSTFTNDIFVEEKKHYVSLFLVADYVSGEAIIKEPEKCSAWQRFDWDALPQPLFLPVTHLVEQGYDPRHAS